MKTVISADQLEAKDIGTVVEALRSRKTVIDRVFQRGVYLGKESSSVRLAISEDGRFYELNLPYGECGFLATEDGVQTTRLLNREEANKYSNLLKRVRPTRVQKASGYCGGRWA